MNTYIEHAADGRILQATECDEAPPASFGGTVVQVEGSVDASRALYQSGEIVHLPPQPSMMHIIDPVARAWVMPGMTSLETAKATKWNEIRDERDRRETAGFPYLGKILDSDSRSVQRITTAVQSAQVAAANGMEFSIDWTCADNSTLTMDANQMIGAPAALALYADDLHRIARSKRAEIEAAETPESATAISWPT